MVENNVYLKILKLILAVFIFLISEHNICAQNLPHSTNPIGSDTSVVRKQKQRFFGFLKRLFHKMPSSNDYVKQKPKKFKLDTAYARKAAKPAIFKLTQGSITWTSLYTQGVNLNTGITGLYTLGHLSQGFDIYGLPFTGQGTGVFYNEQYQKSYSSYSVNFDMETYLANLRKKAKAALINKKVGDKVPDYSDSLAAYESLREKLQSPSYQAEEIAVKTQFHKDEDSLKKHPDSDTTELHTLRNDMHLYEQMEKRYQQLFFIKKNYNSLEKSDSAEKRYEQEEKQLDNPGGIEKVLQENHQLSQYEHFLMGVQKFSIGQCGEEMTEFTFHSFMMKGIDVGYKTNTISGEIGYGKEMAVVDPFLLTGIAVPNYNRTVEFTRIGEGPENGSDFYATIIKIADPGGNNSINETNWVFDLTKQIALGKYLNIQGELAKSSFTYVPGNYTIDPPLYAPTSSNTLAYALRAKGVIPDSKTILKAEVSQTGADFVTLGNPYLVTGATKYEMDISQPIDKKLNIEVEGAHIIEAPTVSDGAKQNDNWIAFTIQYKPVSFINAEFKYAPSQFQQESGPVYANSTTNNINQVSLITNVFLKIFGREATTSIFAGNFQYNNSASSQMLTQNLNLTYYMINELWMIGSTQGINLSIDESRNNWTGGLSQFMGQGTFNWNVKKALSVGLGPQWIEQPGVIPNEAGITGSLGSSIQKWGKISVQYTYRNTIEEPLGKSSQYLISGSISIFW